MRALSRRFVGVAVVAMLLGLVAFSGSAAASVADAGTGFGATLSGGGEVPNSGENTNGLALFSISDDGQSMTYSLALSGATDVMAAHIHLGHPGENGPIVVNLFKGETPGSFSGMLAQGTITTADLVGPMQGKSFDDLIAAMKSGNAYVNAHTKAHPGGVTRGQIVLMEPMRLTG